MQQPRRRLGFWRFVLALLLSLGAWLLFAWYFEPKPLWSTSLQNKYALVPCGTNEDESLILATEVEVMPGQDQSAGARELCILEAKTGRKLHQTALSKQKFDADSYTTLLQAKPRILGTIAWSVTINRVDQEFHTQLCAWDFSRNDGEKVIHTWKYEPGQHFGIVFADNGSPYFLTQSNYPWQPLLTGMSLEGWSQLTTALSFTHHRDENAAPAFISLGRSEFTKQGLVLPYIQTWKLPGNLNEPLKPIAAWMMPPLRKTWPLAIGPDLAWVAFGDTSAHLEWNVREDSAIQPQGTLIYDGRTGQPLTIPAISKLRNTKVRGSGNLLLIQQAKTSALGGIAASYLVDISTGTMLEWPTNIPNIEAIRSMYVVADKTDFVLAFVDLMMSIEDFADAIGSNRNSRVMLLKRKGNTFEHIHQLPIRSDIMNMPNCVSGDELVLQTMQDSAPPFLRELSRKHEWLTPYMEKIWPENQPVVQIVHLPTGKVIKNIAQTHPYRQFQFQETSLLFVLRLKKGAEFKADSIEAWRLPLASQTWSPWWSRVIGVMMFLLCIRLLSRKQPAMKTATS